MAKTDRNVIAEAAVAYEYTLELPNITVPDSIRNSILACVRKADWDGEGADEITGETCRAAIEFVSRVVACEPLIPMPRVSPSVLGSVTLYWRTDTGHLIVRVQADTPSVFYQSEAFGNVRSHGDEPAREVVRRVLQLFGSPHDS